MGQYNEALWILILLFLSYHGFYADCASAQAAIRGRKTLGIDAAEAAPVGLLTASGCYDGWNNCGNTGYGSHEGGDGSGYDSVGSGRGSGGGRYSNSGVIPGDRGVGSIGSGQTRGFGSGAGYKWSSSSRPGYGSGGKGDMGGNGNYGGNDP